MLLNQVYRVQILHFRGRAPCIASLSQARLCEFVTSLHLQNHVNMSHFVLIFFKCLGNNELLLIQMYGLLHVTLSSMPCMVKGGVFAFHPFLRGREEKGVNNMV